MKPLKNPKNEQKTALKAALAGSIPALGTVKTLKTSVLTLSTDKKMTNRTKYKLPEIYDAGGDVSKQWFVFYSFRDPETGKFKRFKVFRDINQTKLKGERIERAKAIRQMVSELLSDGFDPFYEYKPDLTFSVSSCVDLFLDRIKGQLRPKSYNRLYYELRKMKAWFTNQNLGDLHISEVKKSHVFDFLEFALVDGGWTSNKTYNTHKANISRFFNYFINNYEEIIEKNPALKIESRAVTIRGNMPYNDFEFAAIRKAILENDPYLWRICQFVYYAAVRNEAEGINLKVGDVDFAANQLIIRSELSKGKKRQFIPIYPAFREILLEMGLDKTPSDWFIFGRGDAPGPVRVGKDNFYERFKKVREKAGLSSLHGIYSFKHTRAAHMVDDGATLYEIQKLFRHESLQATMEYLKSAGRVWGEKKLSESRKI